MTAARLAMGCWDGNDDGSFAQLWTDGDGSTRAFAEDAGLVRVELVPVERCLRLIGRCFVPGVGHGAPFRLDVKLSTVIGHAHLATAGGVTTLTVRLSRPPYAFLKQETSEEAMLAAPGVLNMDGIFAHPSGHAGEDGSVAQGTGGVPVETEWQRSGDITKGAVMCQANAIQICFAEPGVTQELRRFLGILGNLHVRPRGELAALPTLPLRRAPAPRPLSSWPREAAQILGFRCMYALKQLQSKSFGGSSDTAIDPAVKLMASAACDADEATAERMIHAAARDAAEWLLKAAVPISHSRGASPPPRSAPSAASGAAGGSNAGNNSGQRGIADDGSMDDFGSQFQQSLADSDAAGRGPASHVRDATSGFPAEVWVRRALITPTRVICMPAEADSANRAMRVVSASFRSAQGCYPRRSSIISSAYHSWTRTCRPTTTALDQRAWRTSTIVCRDS